MISAMKRQPEVPKRIDAADMRLIEDKLAAWAAEFSRARKFMEEKDVDLWVFKANYLQLGLKSLTQFVGSLDESLIKAASGNPVTESTRKTRSPSATKAAKKQTTYKRHK